MNRKNIYTSEIYTIHLLEGVKKEGITKAWDCISNRPELERLNSTLTNLGDYLLFD